VAGCPIQQTQTSKTLINPLAKFVTFVDNKSLFVVICTADSCLAGTARGLLNWLIF
jgi:hypothetical protein